MTANVLPELLNFDVECEFTVGSAKHNNGARSVAGNTVKCRTPLSSGTRSPSKPLIYQSALSLSLYPSVSLFPLPWQQDISSKLKLIALKFWDLLGFGSAVAQW